MHVPEALRQRVRAALDDPDQRGKTLAARLNRSRTTLYQILRGNVGPKTLRKVMAEFPEPPAGPG